MFNNVLFFFFLYKLLHVCQIELILDFRLDLFFAVFTINFNDISYYDYHNYDNIKNIKSIVILIINY